MTKELTNLSEELIEEQEHLTKDRFVSLKAKEGWFRVSSAGGARPQTGLVDLMHWTEQTFGSELNNKDLRCYIHNKIIINGSFMTFCEEIGAKIETLYTDSFASWQSDLGFEHFMAQGVFKITYKKTQFLHAALFHKGNQNEDEVSFFVVVSDAQFENYLAFRNQFEEWSKTRDREHLEIHVIGNEGIPYQRDFSWDDLFLPNDLKADIRNSIEGFLAAQDIYQNAKVAWKRGILLYGVPGCGKSSCIKTIISTYDFKPVTVQTSHQTTDDVLTAAFAYAQDQAPGLLYIEDLDTLLGGGSVSLSHFLNLMDGVQSNNGIVVIATANHIGNLKESVIDRPSRFDRKWEIPLPDNEMAIKYLKKWFGKALKSEQFNFLAQKCVKKSFSYAYLKELYLTSVFSAISQGRKEPTQGDIDTALTQLIQDKKAVKENFETKSPFGGLGIE